MKTLITAVLIAVTLGMTQAELRHTQRNYILRRQEAAQILPTSLTLPLSWQIGFAGIDSEILRFAQNDITGAATTQYPHPRNDRVFAESVILRPWSDPDLVLQGEWGP